MPHVRPLGSAQLDDALRRVLADPDSGAPADAQQVAQYRRQLFQPGMSWLGYCCGQAGQMRAVTLAVIFPGRTAVVMLPGPDMPGIDPDAQRGTLLATIAALDARALHYSQALLDPRPGGPAPLLREAGFQRLGRLAYLLHDLQRICAATPGAGVEWRSYQDALRPLFGQTIQATYRDSLDMPELAGRRPIEDVLASHQAAGAFDPSLWELAYIDGRPAGCLLLAVQFDGRLLELVYLGVVPAFRGRGLGGQLVTRALEHACQRGAAAVLVAADERNIPARRLYERFGFRPLVQRDVWVRFATS